MIFRIINENFGILKIIGNQNFKLYNAISPYNIHFFDGGHDIGSTIFDPQKANQIFHSPAYAYGVQPFKIQIKQSVVLKEEYLYVKNLGAPCKVQVSNVLWSILYELDYE